MYDFFVFGFLEDLELLFIIFKVLGRFLIFGLLIKFLIIIVIFIL